MNNYLHFKRLVRKLRNIAKAILKEADNVQLDAQKFLISCIKQGKINYLIQVGSNDGQKNDPVRPLIEKSPSIKAVLIETLKSNFEKLLTNYSAIPHQINFLNAGISNKREKLNFYYIKNILPTEPGWYDQVSSFDKETFLKNIEVIPRLDQRMDVCQIDCFPCLI